MSRLAKPLLVLLAVAAAGGVAARETARPPPTYAPPPETSKFVTAPGVETAQRYCLTCHSADYVSTQPPHMPAAFWQNEVAKMRNAYGATIPDDAAKAIADYLVATYTDPTRVGR
ncbi:cytochrome c [Phenylobacterium sp.]|uniref:SorB family sulfite dehydrogenase c-type cytochrome subunit n=1 Tax=Phenylobacterium sp. TaxID=1871053 RepID=UPI002C688BAB|nr:cytochrome c [Phenylobacterium sp.]HLZ75784.1 cytochrome c [Phenylobacterium sp.]